MKHFPESLRTWWLGWLSAALLALAGCSHSPQPAPASPPIPIPSGGLSAAEAAELAAGLANKECDRLYHREPFTPDRYPATLTEDGYRWGGLDVGAPGGLSALVIFAPDGSNPKVEVYYSTDVLTPQISPGMPPR